MVVMLISLPFVQQYYGSNAASASPPPKDPPGQLNANARSFHPGSEPVSVTTAIGTELCGILRTVMGYLRMDNTRHLVRILLDGGSQATLVREGIFPKDGA